MSRWHVWRGRTGPYRREWLVAPRDGGIAATFPTWREAYAYADAMARSDS